jgi:hypothetical protein
MKRFSLGLGDGGRERAKTASSTSPMATCLTGLMLGPPRWPAIRASLFSRA